MISPSINIATRLRETAARFPTQRAVVFPAGRDWLGRVTYSQLTFAQLDLESDRLAFGLQQLGVRPGTRIVLMVRPGLEFIALTFALFKVGAVVILIDPGMGGKKVFRCLDEVEPEGFISVPIVQVIRALSLGRYKQARFNVTVGTKKLWPGTTYVDLIKRAPAEPGFRFEMAATKGRDLAAVIFTSGSTGPAKGVAYEHGMFVAQVDWIRDRYGIQPGEVDLPGFPLFGLFNAAMGVTTVIPDMDPTRPAHVDPRRILEAIENQGVTQAFGSPAIWNRVGRYCVEQGRNLGTLRRILSAGAPVPIEVLQRLQTVLAAPEAEIFTPYGATESLPVSSISASEVLNETAAMTREGAGTCVGLPFPQIRVAIIPVTEGPIADWSQTSSLPPNKIGEIVVQGDVVTREYFRRTDATLAAKISDGDRFWHRMGDVGYLDATGRLWFCGRKTHIVQTVGGPLYTECIEPVFNVHSLVFRSALVGVGPPGQQRPVLVVEPEEGSFPESAGQQQRFILELRELAIARPETRMIESILFHRSLPVDVRHNVKIDREALAVWAAGELGSKTRE